MLSAFEIYAIGEKLNFNVKVYALICKLHFTMSVAHHCNPTRGAQPVRFDALIVDIVRY